MKYTPEDLAAIKKAILRCEKSVSFGNRRVDFHSISDLIKLHDFIVEQLYPDQSGIHKLGYYINQETKGL